MFAFKKDEIMGIRKCIGIGASMGGPKVLREILPNICEANSCPIFITQHIVLKSTELFRNSLIPFVHDYRIRIAESLDEIEDKTVYLYPGFGHMRIMKRDRGFVLNIFENGCMKNSIDAMFTSIAGNYGSDSTAVILTGMGIDGLNGAYEVKQSGGEVVVQDKESSLVWSMPSAVACRGLADKVLSIASIARHVSATRVLRG